MGGSPVTRRKPKTIISTDEFIKILTEDLEQYKKEMEEKRIEMEKQMKEEDIIRRMGIVGGRCDLPW